MEPDVRAATTPIVVRDLMWVINSPPLLSDSETAISTRAFGHSQSVVADVPTLSSSEIDADHLQRFLADHPARAVGRYFESLVYYWLRYVRGVEVLAHNEQIQQKGRTVGEIDIIFRDEERRVVHWETAVKFYLHFPNRDTFPSDYIGPNSNDNLDRKIERMFGHQLQQSLGWQQEVQLRQAFFKGCIFYHASIPSPAQTHCQLRTDHLRGLWVRLSEIEQLLLSRDQSFRRMQKPHWLATSRDQSTVIKSSDLHDWADQQMRFFDRPLMLCSGRADHTETGEPDRIMIVSDRWPEKTEE